MREKVYIFPPEAPTGQTHVIVDSFTTPVITGVGSTTATTQKNIVSIPNSSTNNLTASSFFTGTSDSTLGVAAIQVTLKASQNCTIYIEQSPDGTNWDISDSFDYNVLKDNFSRTVQAVNSFFRVRVLNKSTTVATTYFRLQSLLCPFIEALPRHTDDNDALTVKMFGLQDTYGTEGQFSPLRALKVCQPFRLIGTVFSSSIDTNFWTATTSGAGSASGVASGIATLSSGTANNGYGLLQTVSPARFVSGEPNLWRGLIRLTAVIVSQCTRRFGNHSVTTTTPLNGVYFEVSPAGVLSVNCVSNSVVNSIASGNFNGDVSEYIVDTSVHAYEIVVYNAAAYFYIDDVFVHKFVPTTAVLYQSLNVPITITTINSGTGTTSGTIECWNTSVFRLGRANTSPVSKYQAGTTAALVLKTGAGAMHSLAVSGVVNNAVVTLYDNTAASGTIIFSTGAMAANTVPFFIDLSDAPFFTGLTLAITGANANATVLYE